MESIIRDIADTARWVAVFRAEESERADAVFRDPYARRLAGERGEQITSAIEFGGAKDGSSSRAPASSMRRSSATSRTDSTPF